MQHFLVKNYLQACQQNQEQGFNLLELTVVMFLIAIATTIGVPSLIGQYNQTQVKDAIFKFKSTLQTAQVNATRKSTSCYLNFSASGSQPPDVDSFDSSNTNCTLGTPDFDEDVVIKHNFTVNTFDPSGINRQYHLEYNYKGNTKDTGTIVVYIPDTALSRCLVVSNGLGMIREGFYDGADPSTVGHIPSSANCTIIQP